MRELTVVEVRVSTKGTAPVVVLQEVNGDRLLPIWMSAGGAAAIVAATEEPELERPAIHDLVGELLSSLGGGLDEVRIVGYDEGSSTPKWWWTGWSSPAVPRTPSPSPCAPSVRSSASRTSWRRPG